MRRGDIWLVDPEPTKGHEQQRRRPVLIVSPKRFNHLTSCPVVLPVTNGGGSARRFGFAVPITGIETTGVVRCDQPRILDLAAHNGRYVDALPEPILEDVLARIGSLFV